MVQLCMEDLGVALLFGSSNLKTVRLWARMCGTGSSMGIGYMLKGAHCLRCWEDDCAVVRHTACCAPPAAKAVGRLLGGGLCGSEAHRMG